MVFTPKNWRFNDIITEGELNRMEQGIADAHQIGEQAQAVADTANQKADQNAADLAAHLNDFTLNPRGNKIYHVEVVSSSVSETPDAGRIIFDTSKGKFFGGNGTGWV